MHFRSPPHVTARVVVPFVRGRRIGPVRGEFVGAFPLVSARLRASPRVSSFASFGVVGSSPHEASLAVHFRSLLRVTRVRRVVDRDGCRHDHAHVTFGHSRARWHETRCTGGPLPSDCKSSPGRCSRSARAQSIRHCVACEAEGWIDAKWQVSDAGRRARFYTLTPSGRRQLKRERASWDEFVAAVTRLIETALIETGKSMPALLRRIRDLLSRDRLDRELDEEMGLHLERLVTRFRNEGLDEAEARRRARIGLVLRNPYGKRHAMPAACVCSRSSVGTSATARACSAKLPGSRPRPSSRSRWGSARRRPFSALSMACC